MNFFKHVGTLILWKNCWLLNYEWLWNLKKKFFFPSKTNCYFKMNPKASISPFTNSHYRAKKSFWIHNVHIFLFCLRSQFMKSSLFDFVPYYCCCSSKKDRVAYQTKIIFLPAFWWLLWHSHHKTKYLKNSIIMLSSCVALISISRKDHNCHINLHFTFFILFT